MKTYFQTPDGHPDKIYVFFDACHMYKLLRNALHDYEVLVSPSGEIAFSTLKGLLDLQENVGLRLANKFTNKHYHYQNLKMKVRSASEYSVTPIFTWYIHQLFENNFLKLPLKRIRSPKCEFTLNVCCRSSFVFHPRFVLLRRLSPLQCHLRLILLERSECQALKTAML